MKATDKKDVNEYKIKASFFKISLFFAFGLSSFFAWSFNNMCHSPVQLAALMSPNKPKISKGEQLRKRIEAMEKKLEDYENKLDDEEGKLGESLNKDRLKDDPYSVAGSIRNYIENSQNGWPCAGSNQKSSFFPAGPVNQINLSNINFLDLLIPPASAETSTQEADIPPAPPAPPAPQTGKEDLDPCEKRAEDGTCICDFGSGLENDRCVVCSSKPGKKWTFTTIGEPCTCPESETIKKDGNKCRLKTCQERGLIGEGSSNCKTQEQVEQIACENKGKKWESGQCICPDPSKYGLEGENCVVCSTKPGGQWTPGAIGEPCQCDVQKNNNLIKKDGQCRLKTNKEKCGDQNKEWVGANENADMSHCKTQDQIDKEECEKTRGKEWINGECQDTPKTQCEKQEGKEWKNGKCQDTPQAECNNRTGNWEYKNNQCECPAPYVEEVKDGNKICREKNKSEKCAERGGILSENGKCACPPEHKIENKKCVPKTEQDKCEEQEGMSWTGQNCIKCPDWKKHPAFGINGKVDSSFCDKYASDKRACKQALSRLARLAKRLEQYNDSIERLEEQLLSLDDSEDVKTEAGGLCFDCLKRELKANQPTAAQNFGNIASMIAGVGMTIGGYNTGKIAQTDANMLRIQQGYPVANDNYALQGATAGFPFLANGLHGMTRVNTPVGGWSCTPTVNPYGHAYANYGYGYGYQMPYY